MDRAGALLRSHRSARRWCVRHAQSGQQARSEGARLAAERPVNLPNAITAGRILAAPFIAALPFIGSPSARGIAFVLYVVVALTDHYDGMHDRSRNPITDLSRVLGPLADNLRLVATLGPLFVLIDPS